MDTFEAEKYAGMYYAWGRQDAEGVTECDKADAFGKAWSLARQAYEAERIWYRPNIEGAYRNWQEHKRIFDTDEHQRRADAVQEG